jgi:hypothetical protein
MQHSYTSYTAGVMIAHKATQKALHGDNFANDIELLNKCIGVLEYCAHKDSLAGKFRDLLTAHLNTLREHNATIDSLRNSTTTPEHLQMSAYLFTVHTGSSKLHTAARDLLQMIHRPFSGLKNVAPQKTLSNRAETTMGTHLEWEYELKGRDCSDNGMNQRASPESADLPRVSSVSDASMQQTLAQTVGESWSTWTPPTWQTSFPGFAEQTLASPQHQDAFGGQSA